MQKDPEEFQKLRRLLALKRSEMPPPGYFKNFSDKVVSRIEADAMQVKWWQRLFGVTQSNPSVAWSLGVAGVALLVVASIQLEDPGAGRTHERDINGGAAAASMVFATNQNTRRDLAEVWLVPKPQPIMIAATNSRVAQPSLFSAPFYDQAAPVSYSP